MVRRHLDFRSCIVNNLWPFIPFPGIPNKIVDLTAGVEKTVPLDIFLYLNKIGWVVALYDAKLFEIRKKATVNVSSIFRGMHGIGRIDIVENRFTGMKSRGSENLSYYKLIISTHGLRYDLFVML